MDDRKQMEERLRAAGVGFTFTEAVRVVTAVRRGDMTLDQAREQIPAAMTYEQIEKVVDTYRGPLTPADDERRALGTPQGAKMTPDEVADLKQELADGTANNGHLRKALAHIAALEAERDEALTQAKGHRLAEALARVSRRMREVLEVEDDSRHSPGVVEAAQALVSERDALRERVKALEQENTRLTEHVKATIGGPFGPEVVLLRDDRNLPEWETHAKALEGRVTELHALRREIESRLSAIRQRAGDEAGLWEVFNAEASITKGLRAVARYIVGEDGAETAQVSEAASPCRSGGTVYSSEAMGEECGNCGEPLCKHSSTPEPTTAEAFAAVRRLARDPMVLKFSGAACSSAAAAVSLLEHHMGAMARAIDEVSVCTTPLRCAVVRGGMGDAGSKPCAACRARAALTDAPPVFTLKEVETVVRGALTDSGEWAPVVDIVMGAIRERLATLRSRP
jgi:polyhydroxyalkanoate synthesis regulator phasin